MTNNHQKRRPPRSDQAAPDFFYLLREGTHALQRGKVELAVELLERAYRLEVDNVDVTLNLAGAYILAKKFRGAVELLEVLVKREPHNPMIWTNLAAAYLGNPVLAKDEDHAQAIAAFKKALELDPVTPNVAYNLGLIYVDRQENDQALYWFKRAVAANPQDRDARNYLKKLSDDEAGKR